MPIRIAVVNNSTLLTNAEITSALPNLQIQIDRDFTPVWGIPATLSFTTPTITDWQLVIFDNVTQANLLGYHEMTMTGMPIGYVFMNHSRSANIPWTIIASHEILEMLVDPAVNLSVLTESSPYQQPDESWLYAYEICDPVQDKSLAYSINGTQVSDFVYPSWFESFWGPFGTQFNYNNSIFFPFQLQSGGYISVNIISSNDGWQELAGYQQISPIADISDPDDDNQKENKKNRKDRLMKRKHRRLLKSNLRRRSLK